MQTALGIDIFRILSTQPSTSQLAPLQLPPSVSTRLTTTHSALDRWRILFDYQIASHMEISQEVYLAYAKRLLANNLIPEVIEVFKTLSTQSHREALLLDLLRGPLGGIDSSRYLSLLQSLLPAHLTYTQPIFDRVTELFVQLGDIDSLLSISSIIPKHLEMDPKLLNNLVIYFLMKEDVDLSLRYYSMASTTAKTPIFPSVYAELITMCMSHDRPEDAMSVYGDYKRSLSRSKGGISPQPVDPRIFNTLILEHSKQGRMEAASQVLNDMLAMKVYPYSRVYGYVVAGYAQQRDFRSAHILIQRMRKLNHRVPTIVYNSLLSALTDAGQMDNAVKLFYEMLANRTSANEYVCTTLISGFAQIGDMGQANQWFEWMKRNKIPPNIFTYSTLINGYMKQLEVESAEEVFKEMSSRGVTPNVVTYTSLIHQANLSLDPETSLALYHKMLEANIKPDVVTYAVLLQGYVQNRDVQGAWKLFEEMRKNQIKPDIYVYSSLLDLFAKLKDMDSARVILELMKKDQVAPNNVSYKTLLTLCFRSKDRANARRIYEKMNGLSPNTTHTNIYPTRIGTPNASAGI
ncbi:hypothetical protein K493DRAFT_314292 [Basidiobolus meristosporus CBS 931.73]|uniref:TPR-like protein n=1 Tax=Basidiobolus meristosporus CBS 931.73 TaxID=1314790 RepID=A0A1Y1YFW5_9FUNG|nr:hypothetical protein K493DRAFT_314292 [Basidiobolus meristosporus CBS 931.73]|eukprot:ORX96930.1 hypothetical protein K493DRAFT_314292 [Basidiobolus meristosporus CBS 931.73]